MDFAIAADKRLRPLAWLWASDAAQAVAFWYPYYVAHHYPSSDGDGRYFILPEIVFAAATVAVLSILILLRRVTGHSRLSSAGVVALATVAGVIALWPLWRILVL